MDGGVFFSLMTSSGFCCCCFCCTEGVELFSLLSEPQFGVATTVGEGEDNDNEESPLTP